MLSKIKEAWKRECVFIVSVKYNGGGFNEYISALRAYYHGNNSNEEHGKYKSKLKADFIKRDSSDNRTYDIRCDKRLEWLYGTTLRISIHEGNNVRQ